MTTFAVGLATLFALVAALLVATGQQNAGSGAIACALSAFLIAGAAYRPEVFAHSSPWLLALAALWIASSQVACPTCASGAAGLLNPGIYAVLALSAIWIGTVFGKLRTFVTPLALLLLLAQPILIAVTPKLCFACLGATAASLGALCKQYYTIDVPTLNWRSLRTIGTSVVLLSIVTIFGAGFGLYKQAMLPARNLVGLDANAGIRSSAVVADGWLIIESKDCPACKIADNFLRRTQIEIARLPICMDGDSQACWKFQEVPVSTPTLIRIESGRIVEAQVGFSEDSWAAALRAR